MLAAVQLQAAALDRHILEPLFAPKSIVVFAGDPDTDRAPTSLAQVLRGELQSGRWKGELTWLDIEMTGTLADLAHSRADLALIALPAEQVAAALEIVGRIRCRAALVLSNGLAAALCKPNCTRSRAATACTCSAPTAWVSSGRRSSSMPAAWARWPRPGRWA
jgi:hypothetical protein